MTKRYSISLSVICSLSIVLYTILCWHSRLATDDYAYIWEVYNFGVLKETCIQYTLWSGRIAATLLTDTIYKLLDVDQTWYFIYPLISGLLLVAGVHKAISTISNHYDFSIHSAQKKLSAILFSILLFFMTIDTGETWFWYNSISHYLGSVIAFTWGIGFLFEKRNHNFSLMLSLFCFLYAGSASEVYSVLWGLFLLWLIYFNFKKHSYNTRDFFRDKWNKKIIIVSLFFLASFIITIVAPGNYVRADFFPKPDFISTIRLSSYMFGKLFFWFLPQKILYIIAFASPFIIIGKQLNKGEIISIKDFLKSIKIITLFLLISCVLVFGMIAFIMSQTGEYRIWFILSFLFTIYLCFVCFYGGYKGLFADKLLGYLKNISVIAGLTVLLYTIFNQYHITKKYAAAHDARVEFLINTNQKIQQDTIIVLPLLPASGMLHSAEITDDPYNFLNEELKQGYRLKFHVVSEKKLP